MSRQRIFLFPLLSIILSLILVACVRPLPEGINTTPIPDGQDDAAPQGEGQPTPTAAESSVPYPPPTDALGGEQPFADEAYPADSAYPAEGYPGNEAGSADAEGDTAVTDEGANSEEDATESSAEEGETDSSTVDTESAPSGPIEHVVGSGQTLFSIGLLYNMSWVTLADYNNLANPNSLSPGQTILIPTLEELNAGLEAETEAETEVAPETTVEEETAVTEEETASAFVEHVVQTGENLYRIALQYDISWVEIANANGLTDPTQLTEGQTLLIPVVQE